MTVQESAEEKLARLRTGPRATEASQIVREAIDVGVLGDDRSHALAMLIVDASLDGDEITLHVASRQLQQFYRALAKAASDEGRLEDRGRVLAFLDMTAWGLERALSLQALAEFEADSFMHEFLKAVRERPGLTNSGIGDIIHTSDAEVSRLGRRLADAGLAAKRRVGRRNHWEITPKGLGTLHLMESGGPSRAQRPHFQLQ